MYCFRQQPLYTHSAQPVIREKMRIDRAHRAQAGIMFSFCESISSRLLLCNLVRFFVSVCVCIVVAARKEQGAT